MGRFILTGISYLPIYQFGKTLQEIELRHQQMLKNDASAKL